MTVAPGEDSPLGRLNASNAKAPSRVLRVEVNGSLHDWFDIEEMGDFVRSTAFADTLLENIARYFHVPVENQAIYDEDGLLTTSADFSRALQRVSPMLYIYDVSEMAPEMKERTVEELATINAGVEQTWKNFSNLGSNVGAPQDVEKPTKDENSHIEAQKNVFNGDDALLSAKTQSPFAVAQPESAFSSQPAPSAPATFGMMQDDQSEAQTFQVYSLNVPTQAPESPSKLASTPALQLAPASDVDKTSLPTTGRTCFAAAQRNEELLAKTTTWSPQGPQVRKSTGPALASQPTVTVQAQQQVTRSPVQRLPTRSATTPTNTTPLLVGNSQSMRWQSSGLPASLAPSATAPSVPYGGVIFQTAHIEDQHLGYISAATAGSMALDRPSSPKRAVTPPPASRRSITPPPQARTACSIETRSVTPTPKRTQTLGVDGRLLNARPPPISPAQVGARSAGLVRMASSSQLSYNSFSGMERTHSPTRAVTPPPASGRSLTPSSMAQQWRGSDVHSQLMWQAQATAGPLRTSITANGGSTPVRSVTHPSCISGGHYSSLSKCRLAFGSVQPGYGSSLGASS